jgi:AcrR family transcriptional regulator
MAKPLIPADDILTHALDLLDTEGIEALSVRRLSAALKISPRTLYQQVGNREALIRALVARHFAQLKLDFKEYDTWESTALHWCLALNNALRAHPFLTELMTIDDRSAVADYVDALLKAALREGIPRPLGTECCRGLAHLTINHSIVEVRALREPQRSATETAKIEQNFPRLVEWVISGVRVEARDVDRKTTRPKRAGRSSGNAAVNRHQ